MADGLTPSPLTLTDSVPFAPDMRTNEGADSTILTSCLVVAFGNRCIRRRVRLRVRVRVRGSGDKAHEGRGGEGMTSVRRCDGRTLYCCLGGVGFVGSASGRMYIGKFNCPRRTTLPLGRNGAGTRGPRTTHGYKGPSED